MPETDYSDSCDYGVPCAFCGISGCTGADCYPNQIIDYDMLLECDHCGSTGAYFVPSAGAGNEFLCDDCLDVYEAIESLKVKNDSTKKL